MPKAPDRDGAAAEKFEEVMAMSARSWLRRTVTMGVLAGLAATGIVAASTPATADTPVVAIAVSPATVIPGDTVTVTETITNDNGFSILQPRAQLFSSPDALTGYTTLTGCDAGPGGTCDTVAGGYEAVFGAAIGGNSQVTATFTLQVDADANGGVETLSGALVATNFATGLIDGPTLTVDARADVAVAMTGTPVHTLLGLTLNFTITVTDDGPAAVRSADVTATIPLGLRVTSTACTPTNTGAVCHIGAVAPGGHATATFSVPVGLLDIGIPFQFSATRSASTPLDPNAANDTATDTCTVVSVLLARCVASSAATR